MLMINRLNLNVCHVCGCYIVNSTEIEEIAFQYLKTIIRFNKEVAHIIDKKVIFYHVSLSFCFLLTCLCK